MNYSEKTTVSEWILDKIPYGWRINSEYHNIKLSIRNVYQRLTKGYADSETWSLDYSLAKWLVPRLKHLRKHMHGIPPNLEKIPTAGMSPEDVYDLTEEQWNEKLDKIIYAFEFILNEDEILQKCYPKDFDWGMNPDWQNINGSLFKDTRKPDYTHYDECQKKYCEGIKIFQLYLRHLWD